MKVTSPAFPSGGDIPVRYTCHGRNVNPPLAFEDIPDAARSLVLIVDDPDAPGPAWVHWVVYDMPVTSRVGEDTVPGTQGTNDSVASGQYSGPRPPSGTHRYFFRVYALDTRPGLAGGADRRTVERAMEGHVLSSAELIGRFPARGRAVR